jgi:hypothetical protein
VKGKEEVTHLAAISIKDAAQAARAAESCSAFKSSAGDDLSMLFLCLPPFAVQAPVIDCSLYGCLPLPYPGSGACQGICAFAVKFV